MGAMTADKKNTWICDAERTVLQSPTMSVVEQQCHSSENGREYTFYLLRSRDWCHVIPVTEDGKVVLVKQYRIGITSHTIEVPGGVIDAKDKDAQSAALREMEEETGYSPLPGAKIQALGWTHPNPAILNNRCHSIIVGPVRRTREQKLDPGEMIEVVEIPISELPGRILKGEFTHALMLNAFLFLMLRNASGPDFLASQLEAFGRA
jgi:ADP-ribose pyrophosphatase